MNFVEKSLADEREAYKRTPSEETKIEKELLWEFIEFRPYIKLCNTKAGLPVDEALTIGNPALFRLYQNQSVRLYHALCEHSVCNLNKSCNVCACYEVALHTEGLCCLNGSIKDILHNNLELFVNLFCTPGVTH